MASSEARQLVEASSVVATSVSAQSVPRPALAEDYASAVLLSHRRLQLQAAARRAQARGDLVSVVARERERRALLRRRPNVTSWRALLETARGEYERSLGVTPTTLPVAM